MVYCTQVCKMGTAPPLPPYVHLASTECQSHDTCFQALPVFRCFPASVYYTERNRRTKNGGGLGTRLMINNLLQFSQDNISQCKNAQGLHSCNLVSRTSTVHHILTHVACVRTWFSWFLICCNKVHAHCS